MEKRLNKVVTDGDYSLLYPEEAKTIAVHWHGYKYVTNDHTDGGALKHHNDYLAAVKMLCPNKEWVNGLDWCSGDGGLGMMFLGEKLVKHMTFMDRYDPAIKGCKFNITYNKIENLTEVVKADKISDIKGKYDFVIGNAPSQRLCSLTRMYKLGWLSSKKDSPMTLEEAIADREQKNPHRAIDWNWETHKEFFANIHEKLNPGADVFLFENPNDFNPLFWEWGETKLKLIQWVDHNQIPELNKHPQVILHFRYE